METTSINGACAYYFAEYQRAKNQTIVKIKQMKSTHNIAAFPQLPGRIENPDCEMNRNNVR
jgi:hypothetical protein